MIFLAIFAVFTIGFGVTGTALSRRQSFLEDRLKRFLWIGESRAEKEEGEEARPTQSKPKKPLGPRVMSFLGDRFAGRSFVMRWAKALEESGVPLKPEEFFALKLMVAVGFFLLSILFGLGAVVSLLCGMIGYKLPDVELKRRKERRLRRCASQLPVALGSMATSLRAGFSFMQALQMIARELPDPLGPEFARTLREMNFGISVEEALQRLTERLPDEDLEMVVMALLIQRSTGGNLAELVDSVQETIQERVRFKEELRTLTAQGRASAWIVTLLPVILGLFFQLVNPEYLAPLLSHPLGWGFIAYGVISGLIGWVAMKKVIRIEV